MTLSPVFRRPYAENCCDPPTRSAVLLGLMRSWTTRRFLTLDVPLTVELVRVAVTIASAADVSAVYIPRDEIVPADATQRTDTGTLTPASVRPTTPN